jgi:hypothetical protein
MYIQTFQILGDEYDMQILIINLLFFVTIYSAVIDPGLVRCCKCQNRSPKTVLHQLHTNFRMFHRYVEILNNFLHSRKKMQNHE